jgi:HTH-type transcriptional regulator/antitoxin HigA
MHVISFKKLREFWNDYPDAEIRLRAWYRAANDAAWGKFADVRATFSDVDQVGKFTVFNIRGNRYRLIAHIHYNRGKVYVRNWHTKNTTRESGKKSEVKMAAKASRTEKGAGKYFALVRQLPLRPIRSEAQLDRAIEMIDSLIDRDSLDPAEEDYLDVLGDLVHRYETEEHSMPPVSDGEMLQFLIEAKIVTQAEVATATGIAESTISEVLSGKRHLNRHHIGLLARYFHVSPAVFAFE